MFDIWAIMVPFDLCIYRSFAKADGVPIYLLI